jgi:hypothetical protein
MRYYLGDFYLKKKGLLKDSYIKVKGYIDKKRGIFYREKIKGLS